MTGPPTHVLAEAPRLGPTGTAALSITLRTSPPPPSQRPRVWFGRVHSTSAASGPCAIDWHRLEEHETVPPA